MKRMILAAALGMLSTVASASTSIQLSEDGVHASVSYSDLNLHSAVDRSKMTGRIRMAAEMLCFDANSVGSVCGQPDALPMLPRRSRKRGPPNE